MIAVLLSATLVLAACSDDDTEVATDREESADASPTALPGLNEEIGEAEITIEDGQFDVDRVELLEDRPTVLHVINTDDTSYWFQIGDLVNGTEIPAGETYAVNFTTPKSEQYDGELLNQEGGDVLDSMVVDVQQAGETGT